MKFSRGARSFAAVALALSLALSGCGEGKNSKNSTGNGPAGASGVLRVHASSSPSHQANFNPFASSVLVGTRGLVYEPLMIFTPMKPNEDIPSLAEKMEFSQDGKKVTFSLRKGVEWSDGKPFTAKDVAYTFNLLVKEPALNTAGLPVAGARALDDQTAEVDLTQVGFSRKPLIGGVTPVPEHIFSSQKVMDFTNEKPVGTGPYRLKSFSAQVYTFEKNPTYWDKDKVKVQEIAFPASTKETFTTNLSTGKLDWASGFVANVEQVFVAKDKAHNKFWYPGDGNVNLYVNNTKAPMNDLKVRQALSYAMDREEISQVAEQGYLPPAHPSGVVLPTHEAMLDPRYKDLKFEHNVDKANKLLDEAGYKKGADGIRTTPKGEKMSYDLIVPTGWVDTISMSKLVQQQFKKIGVEVKPGTVALANWIDMRKQGNFTMTISSTAAGQTPYFHFRTFMSGEFKVPADQPAISNQNRFYSDEADKWFKQYEGTLDETKQKEALWGLQKIMVEELPIIPILRSPNWFQYSTKNFVGWPDEKDPYALPAAYNFPDILLVVKRLQPVK